jgi:hypothetical protein
MVHNGIEYGIMAAYAEGMNILRHANAGEQGHAIDAETTPLRDPDLYRYDLNLRDIAEVWRRGSVIASWLLDLTATALTQDPALENFAGRVSDASARAARQRSPTSCSPPCAMNSGVMWRSPQAECIGLGVKLEANMSAVANPVLDSPRPMTSAQLDQLSINCIRTLSMDAVQQAKSGHPGRPMALAP